MQNESPICSTIAAAQAEGLAFEAVERRVWDRHGVTCAVLALDSSGMTRISRDLGIVHFLSQYMRMRDLARDVLEQHRCLAWRSFADNLFAEFKDPQSAFSAARGIHAALRDSKLMLTPSEPYRVCIGIGYARVLNNGALGVMGDEMNVVAKLAEDIATGGETLLTEPAYQALEVRPAAEKTVMLLSNVAIAYYRVG